MRRILTFVSVAVLTIGLVATGALADDTFVPDPDEVGLDVDEAPSAQVDVMLVAGDFNPGQDDQCQLVGGGHYVNATVASSDTDVATVSPGTLQFTSCGQTLPITITSVGCGPAEVTVTATDWNARGGDAVFNTGTITVEVTGCNGDDDNGGGITVCAEPAAPAWANAILAGYNASAPASQQIKGKKHGEAISAVARHMTQGATFSGVAKSQQPEYAAAVAAFLQSHTGKTMPNPTDVARPGWACETNGGGEA